MSESVTVGPPGAECLIAVHSNCLTFLRWSLPPCQEWRQNGILQLVSRERCPSGGRKVCMFSHYLSSPL